LDRADDESGNITATLGAPSGDISEWTILEIERAALRAEICILSWRLRGVKEVPLGGGSRVSLTELESNLQIAYDSARSEKNLRAYEEFARKLKEVSDAIPE
jgi:hypothetical protein